MHGLNKLDAAARLFIVKAALTSRPMRAAQLGLMADPRVARRPEAFREAMADEMTTSVEP